MRQLTNLDASFLHLEHTCAPMHVGGTLIFEAPADGTMTFARLRAHVESRLPTARVFRERLLMPATPLENPAWIADRAVDLDQHLRCTRVKAPLDITALGSVRDAFFEELLPRDRPLWNLLYVEEEPVRNARAQGKENTGRFAVLIKIHHAAADGISAEAVLTGLLDPEPRARRQAPIEEDMDVPPAHRRLADSLRNAMVEAPWRDLLGTAAQVGKRFARRTLNARERELPYHFRVPSTPFNRPVGDYRVFPQVQMPLDLLQELRHAIPGSKINDVVLAICGGALRRYLHGHGALPVRSLVAMTPVSRRPKEGECGGNKVSSMLIPLSTHMEDPLQRLGRICQDTALAKTYNRELPLELLFDELPSAGPALFLNTWKRLGLSRRLPPLFNVIVTNVPGSPVPLYFDGARMTSLTGMAGIYDGAGLTMVVTSYAGNLNIGITSSPEVMPDPAHFADCLQQALDDLVAAARPGRRAVYGVHRNDRVATG